MPINPFAPKPHLVGQPLNIQHVQLQVIAFCQCRPDRRDQTLMILLRGIPTECPQCHKAFLLNGFDENGDINYSIGSKREAMLQ